MVLLMIHIALNRTNKYYCNQTRRKKFMSKILRIKEVSERTGLSKTVIYSKIKNGTFPQQFKLSTKVVGWLEEEVSDWIMNLPRCLANSTKA